MIASYGCLQTLISLGNLRAKVPPVATWFWLDQTLISQSMHSARNKLRLLVPSTEAEVIAASHAVRTQGLPSLSLFNYILALTDPEALPQVKAKSAGLTAKPKVPKQNDPVSIACIDPELDELRYGYFHNGPESVAKIYSYTLTHFQRKVYGRQPSYHHHSNEWVAHTNETRRSHSAGIFRLVETAVRVRTVCPHKC